MIKQANCLKILLTKESQDTFYGTVSNIDLFDYIQMLLMSRQKVLVEAQSIDNEFGRLFIAAGNVVHAKCGQITGKKLFSNA